MKNNSYLLYITDLLKPLGAITSRAMFGGYGIYQNGLFFAIIVQDCLYFKVDDHNKAYYVQHGSTPFSYQGKNDKSVVMNYWQVPIAILEDSEKLSEWVQASVNAAKQSKK